MQEFKPVTKQDAPRLRRYYQTCNFGLCEYSVGTKLMWKAALHPAWAEIAGCLVVRNEIDGQVVTDFPATEKLNRAKPVWKTLPGWNCDIRGIRKYEELPEACRNYVETIEKEIGVRISMVSNGPGREDIIIRS